MVQVNDQLVQEMVQKVLQHVESGWGGRVSPTVGKSASAPLTSNGAAWVAPGPAAAYVGVL